MNQCLSIVILIVTVLCSNVVANIDSRHENWMNQILAEVQPRQVKDTLVRPMYSWAIENLGLQQDGSVDSDKIRNFLHPMVQETPLLTWDEENSGRDWNKYVDKIVKEVVHDFEKRKENVGDWRPFGKDPYPYFAFIPPIQGKVIPDSGKTVTWEGECFKENTASATSSTDSNGNIKIKLEITAKKARSLFCMDTYLLGTVENLKIKGIFFHGKHTIEWTVPASTTESEVWDVMNKGIRVMMFEDHPVQVVIDILETVLLFLEPELEAKVTVLAGKRNQYFLSQYTHLPQMKERSSGFVDIDESTINSGDFFGIIRLDGLDPMLAWAMGSTTGHTTVALRDENGDLFVAESTARDSYWSVDGIQKTPFNLWIEAAHNASFNVVHAPLSPEFQKKFNETLANDFFKSVEGLEYGYHNMLWGWIDQMKDNYPCVAPDFERCLEWDHIEVLFGFLDKVSPSLSSLMWNPAWNLRVGGEGLSTADIYKKAHDLGIEEGHLPMIVEQDSWVYPTTKYGKSVTGPSMVCNVFVCNTWKAAGVFSEIDNEVNCGEFTNWDAYSLAIFDANRTGANRAQVCIDADPDNQLCQLTGKYTIRLNDYNTKEMHSHMAENCPSLSPDYPRDPKC